MQDVGASLTSPNLLQTMFDFEPALMGSHSLLSNPVADTHPMQRWRVIADARDCSADGEGWGCYRTAKMTEDSRFSTLEARLEHASECLQELRAALSENTVANWGKRFAAAAVPATAALHLPDMLSDSQLAHRQLFGETQSPPDGRSLPYTNTPFKVTGEETGADVPPQLVGADTEAVLAEISYKVARIESLRVRAVI